MVSGKVLFTDAENTYISRRVDYVWGTLLDWEIVGPWDEDNLKAFFAQEIGLALQAARSGELAGKDEE